MITSDTPGIDSNIVNDSLRELDSHDLVIGPPLRDVDRLEDIRSINWNSLAKTWCYTTNLVRKYLS